MTNPPPTPPSNAAPAVPDWCVKAAEAIAFAQADAILHDDAWYRNISYIIAKFAPVPIAVPDAGVVEKLRLAQAANGCTTFNEKNCTCDPSVGHCPCEYCATYSALTAAIERFTHPLPCVADAGVREKVKEILREVRDEVTGLGEATDAILALLPTPAHGEGRDTARLDCMSKQTRIDYCTNYWKITDQKTLRQAIDAAMPPTTPPRE